MQPGTDIGHYNILRPLGAGGMGEVYLAHDTKLDRDVAVKVLPESLRSDPERLARFRREAKAAASLQHPNIGTIFALEEIDDSLFIAMEYVDGQTLAEAIPDGGMDLDAFFATFIPLADALAQAHDQGRVHRDIKPGNIMIAKDGTPKILDFGLARILPQEEDVLDTEAPTKTMKVAEPDPSAMHDGPRLMGTPQYMSPEQAEGRELDHRTDIFSFGVVMYEALTGRKAFEGSSRTSLLASILKEDPEPVTTIKAVTPYALWLSIERCLRKDPVARTQMASVLVDDLRGVQRDVDAGTVLVDATDIHEREDPSTIQVWRQPSVIAGMGITLVIGLIAAWSLKPVSPGPEPVLRKFQWEVEGLGVGDPQGGPVVSPDGSMLAYVANRRLWIQDMVLLTSREIPKTDGASKPFWSPNSDFVAYFDNVQGYLKKTRVDADKPQNICPLPVLDVNSNGAHWHQDGSILFADGNIYEVSAQGGEPKLIMETDATVSHFDSPRYLPDGETLLYVVAEPNGRHVLMSRRKGDQYNPLEQMEGWNHGMLYAQSGHILYLNSREARAVGPYSLWAVPFAFDDQVTMGPPILLAEEIGSASVSREGTLVYTSSFTPGSGQIVWVGRSGRVLGKIGTPQQSMQAPALSPDERYVAVHARYQSNVDIWVHDIERGTKSRLTFEPTADFTPAWSPDGTQVAFSSLRNGNSDIFRRSVDGSDSPRALVSGPQNDRKPDWSYDGSKLLYFSDNGGTQDIWEALLDGDQAPIPLMETRHREIFPALSPNGVYLAYVSDESGQDEVYVRHYPSGTGRSQLGAGTMPKWRADGTELFYVDGDSLTVVSTSTQGAFRAGLPRKLFSAGQVQSSGLINYDVSADGQRFVVVQEIDEREAPTIIVVQNWHQEFKDRE
jgi:eukaryotic-like serine/threonine-protein kinase